MCSACSTLRSGTHQLGSILHFGGFSIVVAHTQYNSPDPESYPDFTFVPLPDGVAGEDVYFHNMSVLADINTNCKDALREYMTQMLDQAEIHGEVACVIYDGLMWFADPVAAELKIPTIMLRTTSAAYMNAHFPLFQLESDNALPLPEFELEELVPDLYPLRYKDIPFPVSILAMPEAVSTFLHSYLDIGSSSAVIWNTIEMLEQLNLNGLEQKHWRVPFFPIGPIHKLAPALLPTTSLMKEDTGCLSWLEKQAPNSVVYVSLGSLEAIHEKAFVEMAWGLAKSEHPFLWVIRPSSVCGSEAMECLPEGFFEMIKERGCIVKWAPQIKVLAHSSVGGFLTHCGWNSILEGISEGVPMICRPCNGDQMINARYVSDVWKLGLGLEQVTQVSIQEAVRKLMGGEQGKEIRQRVLGIKQQLEGTVTIGGSSHKSLEDLVEFIMSLSAKK